MERSTIPNKASGPNALFFWELEASVLKCLDLPTRKVCSNFNGPNERDRWSILVIRELDNPLALRVFDTILDVVRAKEEFLWLQTIESMLLPKSGIDGSRGVLAIDDNFGNAFLLGDH